MMGMPADSSERPRRFFLSLQSTQQVSRLVAAITRGTLRGQPLSPEAHREASCYPPRPTERPAAIPRGTPRGQLAGRRYPPRPAERPAGWSPLSPEAL